MAHHLGFHAEVGGRKGGRKPSVRPKSWRVPERSSRQG